MRYIILIISKYFGNMNKMNTIYYKNFEIEIFKKNLSSVLEKIQV